jgi:hypothetical protein
MIVCEAKAQSGKKVMKKKNGDQRMCGKVKEEEGGTGPMTDEEMKGEFLWPGRLVAEQTALGWPECCW